MQAATTLLVLGMAGVQLRENPLRRSRMPERRMLILDGILCLTGILAAIAIADHAWALPLLIAPAVVAYRAVRDGVALQAQTRVAQAAVQEASAALAVREEFLTMAAHEFRTPLTSLRMYLELAQRRLRRGVEPEETGRLLAEATGQIQRLTRLVSDVLDQAAAGAPRLTVEQQPTAIGPLVQRTVEHIQAAEPKRVIQLTLPPSSPVVPADPARLEQVLGNLLDNARKYSAPAAPIAVAVRVTPEAVAIAVQDWGIGIPPGDIPRIFDRLHRAANVDQNIAGLGLGLYLSRVLVERHGGQISVTSAVGQGSTFTVLLPLANAGTGVQADAPADRQPA
jgi:signal transduction histidine kinase